MSAATERRARGGLALHSDLRTRLIHCLRVVAAFNWTEVKEGIRFLGHVGKAGRSAHLAAQLHLDLMVRTERNRWFDGPTTKKSIEDSCRHFVLR